MGGISNEMMFYGGLILVGSSVLLAIIFLCVSKVKATRLNAQLDKEYGEKDK